MERALARHGTFEHCDAFDIAEGSVQIAREMAEKQGIDNISYFVGDANSLILGSNKYDVIWIAAALHHLESLEHVMQQANQSLRPDGLLILFEYIGPNRFQFPARQKEIANLTLRLLPAKYRVPVQEALNTESERTPFSKGIKWTISRLYDKTKDGDIIGVIKRRLHFYKMRMNKRRVEKSDVFFPSARDVIAEDPSEAIRSEEIVTLLQEYFEIIEKKDWGGNIIQFVLSGIAGNFLAEDKQTKALIDMIMDIEDTLLLCGEYESDFSYIVAKPLPSAMIR